MPHAITSCHHTHAPLMPQVAILFPATKNATGSYDVALELPSPEGAGLWQALCVGAIIVSLLEWTL
eukprot:1159568-Pelagomonas_calceolata.AAC.3